ncbi:MULTISPECIES: hypothetical protein [Streptomyces]|uniref:hypothetical protein n=1 Tax=Streptomyces TaxID=1883 RepID=UPI001E649044|nr:MULTISPECIES: hypothetical protein [Streptomyces]UFQ15703.1 hypothetical protein J2N69_12235 [Streptomyces huasconensis]WCL85306.1 hypothetical protein PPN52_12245 [Streptomyces sp. JCM 35825]
MAASANLLLSALSKQVPAPETHLISGRGAHPLSARGARRAADPGARQVSGPDSGLEGSSSCTCLEPPLTSEPPLADAAPLTSEPPLADAAPLTSEPTATGTASGLDPMGV